MNGNVIRYGRATAHRLLSGGWLCDRGDPYPTFQPDGPSALALLRAWTTTDLPGRFGAGSAAPTIRGDGVAGSANDPRTGPATTNCATRPT